MNTAIIVAAGSGRRFGGDVPKQFIEIHGKPLLVHTIEKFDQCEAVDEIVVVLAESEIDGFSSVLNSADLSVPNRLVVGGETRSDSVYNGLKSVAGNPEGIVAVHDGARPLVSPREISQTISRAMEFGAACLVCEVTDTIKRVSGGKIVETVDRDELRRALTPQCFRYEIIKRAFDAGEIGSHVTDECYLVEKLGCEIAAVTGSPLNIKVTSSDDLNFVERVLEQSRIKNA